MNTLLNTISLSIGYHHHVLFDSLNLNLQAGELVCFMGPNGIGKSSLVRTLAGIQKPLDGKVVVNSDHSSARFRQLAVVLTDKITAGNMTVYELITFGRYPYLGWDVKLSKEDHNIIKDCISQVHIEHLINEKISELSDGQLQMVTIARALAQDTSIILLDEPTAHLDLNNRVEIMKLLRRLSHEFNKAVLVATHELDLALQTADVIWLTGKQKNIMVGTPEDLVLNGSFDDIFEFKGFDLKTGKLQHVPYRNISIILKGKGSELLWTKNALERTGFQVLTETAALDSEDGISVEIKIEESKPRWLLRKNKQLYELNSLAALIKQI